MNKFDPIIEVIEEAYEIPHLGVTRKISALLPYDYYRTAQKYPVLYLQDGQNLFNPEAPYGDWAIDKSLGKLAAKGFKDIIIIAVDHGEQKRILEYLPYDHPRFGEGKGKLYIGFMMEKLIPYVHKKYRALAGPEFTGIGGSSMGGLISLYGGLIKPEMFGKMLIFSPSLWISEKIFNLAETFEPVPEAKIYVYAGGKESESHLPNVKKLAAVFEKKLNNGVLFDVELSVNQQGKHKEDFWREEFPKALQWLFFKKKNMIISAQEPLNPKLDLILPLHKDQLNFEVLNEFTQQKKFDFVGDFSEILMFYGTQGQRIYLLGLGNEKHTSRQSEAFRSLFFNHKKNWSGNVQMDCRHLEPNEIQQAALGFGLSEYQIGTYKHEPTHRTREQQEPGDLIFITNKEITPEISEGTQTADTINSIKTLVDAPANIKTPQHLSEWSIQSANRYGYDCKVLDLQDLEKEGLKAVIAVGQGSVNEPRFIINSYLPNDNGTVDLGLVGKGITFDSGGVSIKGSTNLHYMKSDMGGAAAVLGAVELAAKLKLNINVIGIVAAAENAVDAKSYRPSDVIESYSGKTIEIIDTDAEGRLVLADGLSYMIRNYQPKQLIDVATLTGSVVRTLGYSAGGMFTNNDEMAQRMTEVGNSNHERVWRLPLFDDFAEELHSDIADIRNFSGKPIAGAITAAKFLEAFTEEHTAWMHLDIAGVAFGSNLYAKMKSSHGFGVRLLKDFMKTYNQ